MAVNTMIDAVHHFAEQGTYSVATARAPVLHYFPVRGRAEPIRLVLAYKQIKWFEPPVEPVYAMMRADLDTYPFRQLPKYIEDVHGELDIVQSNAILRHLGRRHGLYGTNVVEFARVDMMLDGIADLRDKLKDVWIVKKLEKSAMDAYCGTVLATEEELKKSNMPGVGMACFEHILEARVREGHDSPWLVGPQLTVADFTLFDMVDLHLIHFSKTMQRFPLLLQHHGQLADLEGVKQYLLSNERHRMIWLVDWLEASRVS